MHLLSTSLSVTPFFTAKQAYNTCWAGFVPEAENMKVGLGSG